MAIRHNPEGRAHNGTRWATHDAHRGGGGTELDELLVVGLISVVMGSTIRFHPAEVVQFGIKVPEPL